MSTHRATRRALVALLLVPLPALVACASGGARADGQAGTTAAAPTGGMLRQGDTASPRSNEAKSIENLISGRFSGVTVTAAGGGGLQIRIRGGSNSFYAGGEPLFVVDDTPVPAGTGGVVMLNPYDIENIVVLKNPVDIALYGVRGANGVIKITTTRPRK